MKLRHAFSIIEMMTVVLIVLLLLSLSIPIFVNLKINARTALCKGNLRQIGALMTSYATDHNGYLPNDAAHGMYVPSNNPKSDIPIPYCQMYTDGPNTELYRYWNGHLLPYFDVNLPDKFERWAMVTKAGVTRGFGQLGTPPPFVPPAKPLKNGWVVVDDALKVGGYNDLKAFICPEIHGSTIDINQSNAWNGVQIPRISQLCMQGFQDVNGFDYGYNGGTPTTYVANEKFFGLDYHKNIVYQSYRIDQIADISNKAFLLEGGTIGTEPYYSQGGLNGYSIGSNSALSFVHDNLNQFWIMPGFVGWGNYFPNMWWSYDKQREVVARFNIQFAPKAYMIYGGATWGYGGNPIVSYIDPALIKDQFTSFFSTNFPGTVPLNPFVQYTDTPNEYMFTTGNTNVLFGDGSVVTKDQAWLSNNKQRIAGETKE